jgi:hypothetical protein
LEGLGEGKRIMCNLDRLKTDSSNRIQFIPHRKFITSPLQSPTDYGNENRTKLNAEFYMLKQVVIILTLGSKGLRNIARVE